MSCGTFSPIARSTCHGRIPNPLPVDIKDEVCIRGRDVPFVARELAFELTSAPSCVAEGEQYLLRAGLVRDVANHLPAWGNGGKFFYSDGVEAVVVNAVHDEAHTRLHRAPREDLYLAFR